MGPAVFHCPLTVKVSRRKRPVGRKHEEGLGGLRERGGRDRV